MSPRMRSTLNPRIYKKGSFRLSVGYWAVSKLELKMPPRMGSIAYSSSEAAFFSGPSESAYTNGFGL
jgi:hypothetical protein